MKAGIIATVDGTFNDVDSFVIGDGSNGVQACVEVTSREQSAINGNTLITGRAAIQEKEIIESVSITDGSIKVGEEPDTNTKYTEFICICGSFVITRSGKGAFVFDLLSREIPGVEINKSKIDLESFLEENPDIEAWQLGFYGHPGEAEKGTVYGQNVVMDGEVGNVLKNAQKNQLGGILGEDEVKFLITESGYIEIYQPSNYVDKEFCEFIDQFVLHHVIEDK